MPTTVAAYIRCSTSEQTADIQRPALIQMAAARGWAPVFYEDQAVSGVKERPELERVLKLARQGKLAGVMVWALDRLGRSSYEVAGIILELDRLGVKIVSHQESWLDTFSPARSLLIYVFSWVAEQERARLIERTKAGIQHARDHGTKSGRPIGRPFVEIKPQLLTLAKTLREDGSTWREIAAATGINTRTLVRALKAATT